MKCNFSLAIVCSFLLMLFANSAQSALVPAAADPDLKCYICNDCATVNSDTPTANCDAEYFRDTSTTTMTTVEDSTTSTESSTQSSMGSTMESTASTTEMIESSSSSSSSSSTSSSTMTTENSTVEDSTTVSESTTDESTSTTEGSTTPTTTTRPTPPTIGPELTTTAMPTPPNPGYAAAISDTVIQKVGVPGAAGSSGPFGAPGASADRLERQRRAVNDGYTYHCYSVQNSVNGSQVTERGCARVTTMQSVCGELEGENPNVVAKSCNPCSMSLCNSNSSSALNVSVLAIVMGILATLFRQH